MTRKTWLRAGAALLVVAALVVKWRTDVGALDRSRSFASLRLADNYHIDMARTVGDLDRALVDIDQDLAELDSLWFVSPSEKAEVRQQWRQYRERVEKARAEYRSE